MTTSRTALDLLFGWPAAVGTQAISSAGLVNNLMFLFYRIERKRTAWIKSLSAHRRRSEGGGPWRLREDVDRRAKEQEEKDYGDGRAPVPLCSDKVLMARSSPEKAGQILMIHSLASLCTTALLERSS
jgi:hypothetical protein